jgi:hypothetical protein
VFNSPILIASSDLNQRTWNPFTGRQYSQSVGAVTDRFSLAANPGKASYIDWQRRLFPDLIKCYPSLPWQNEFASPEVIADYDPTAVRGNGSAGNET